MARNNPGVGRLLAAMRKLIAEVNDQEICRRLDILMNSEKEDLPPNLIKRLLESPESFDAREVQEPYTQYVKHYLYMVKRAAREKSRQSAISSERKAPSRKKKSANVRKTKSGANARSGGNTESTVDKTAGSLLD